jgi:hypothetical protein
MQLKADFEKIGIESFRRHAQEEASTLCFLVELGNDVRGKLIFEKCQTVAKEEFALLKPLDLQPVSGTNMEQCLDRGI